MPSSSKIASPAPSSSSSSLPATPSSCGEDASATEDRHVLDLRGEVCPYTFVYMRLRLEELPLGARLTVLVDHEPATRNLPRSARDWGQEVCEVAVEPGGVWRVVVKKRVA